MELAQFLQTLRRHMLLILALPLLALAAAYVAVPSGASTYEAEAQLLVLKSGLLLNLEPKVRSVSDLDSTTGVDQIARRRALGALGKSPEIAARVASKLGTQLSESEHDPVMLLGMVDVAADGEVLRVRARTNSAQKSAALANAWAQEYLNYLNALYSDIALPLDELKVQVEQARRDYEAKENALISFLSTSTLDSLNSQLTQKQQKLSDTAALQAKIDRLLSDALSLRTRLRSGTTSSIGDELAAMILEANAFSASSTQPNPAGTGLSVQVNVSPSNSASSADLLGSLDALIATLQERRSALNADALTTAQSEIGKLQSQVEQETERKQALARARDAASQAYTALLNKMGEVALAEQSRSTLARLAVPAIVPTSAMTTNRSLNFTLFGTIGL
ncbi:MAG: hypothetical protein LC737_08210, partial [Chloroflexi bacterium]|nr:hypothetical protein [Chloroflexota bacterium]